MSRLNPDIDRSNDVVLISLRLLESKLYNDATSASSGFTVGSMWKYFMSGDIEVWTASHRVRVYDRKQFKLSASAIIDGALREVQAARALRWEVIAGE